jgi:hypothetical protein
MHAGDVHEEDASYSLLAAAALHCIVDHSMTGNEHMHDACINLFGEP